MSEVEKLLQLPRSTIRTLIKAGLVSPARGPRGAWRFSFQDLIVLRQAQALIAVKVPAQRVARAMQELRRRAASGQYLLEFGKVLKQKAAPAGGIEAQIDRGYALHEAGRLPEAAAVYRDALRSHGSNPVLHYNLGVLLEDMGRRADAMRAYLAALRADPRLADGHYNVALLYEAQGKRKDAIRHMAQYRRLTRGRSK